MTIGKIKVSNVSDLDKNVPIVDNDVIVYVEPDSRADVNVMDERQYGALKRKTQEDITLKTSKTKLSTVQNELKVSCEFKTTVRNQTRGTETTFVVVKGKIKSPPLLGKKTLSELGMLEIRPDWTLKDQNELRIRYENNVQSILDATGRSDVEMILQRHDEVFKGIGNIYDKKNGEEFLVKFSMKSEAAPIAQKPRPVPYYLKEPLKKYWLDECIK